ncbi:MAG TPA: hypothetical protein VLA00_17920 [Xanthobacteraceae bacterium]|nr:hypothetical protein [Xanthobacteraceae bacterium]
MGAVIIITGLVVAILGVVSAVNGLAIYETTFGTALVTLGGIGLVGGVVILVLGVIQRTLARIVERLDSVIQFELDEAEQHRLDPHHGSDSLTAPVALNLNLGAPPVPIPAAAFAEPPAAAPATPAPRRPPAATESPAPDAALGTLPSWFHRDPDDAQAPKPAALPMAAPVASPVAAPPPFLPPAIEPAEPEPGKSGPAKSEPAKAESTSWFRRGREPAAAAIPPAVPAAIIPAAPTPPAPPAALGPLDPVDEHDPFGPEPAPARTEAAWEKQMQEDFASSALESVRGAAVRAEPSWAEPAAPSSDAPPAPVPEMPRMPQAGGFASPPLPRSIVVLKSGIIGGMAYKLYSDGSIEAELPDGQLRFASLQELREHVTRNEPDAG